MDVCLNYIVFAVIVDYLTRHFEMHSHKLRGLCILVTALSWSVLLWMMKDSHGAGIYCGKASNPLQAILSERR